MLSVNLIQRHFETGRFDSLLDALASNGLELPLPLQIRLSQSAASAIGLALRRVVELTYGPTSLSRSMTRRLIDSQEADGSFGHDPLATAAASAALAKLAADQPAVADEEVTLAHERALAALAAMQADSGLFQSPTLGVDRTEQEKALTSAFILHLLAGDDAFRGAVRLADLMTWFEQHADALDTPTQRMWAMASVDADYLTARATAGDRGSPALNAIAA